MKLRAKYIIRNKTNSGELCKFMVFVVGNKPEDMTIIIDKFVLTECYESIQMKEWNLLRTFKDKVLLKQQFSMKLDTFGLISELLDGNIK